MNKGMFAKENGKLFVYVFEDGVEIPFKKLENAIVTEEINGHYLITEMKEKNAAKDKVAIYENGEKLEDLMKSEHLTVENVFEGGNSDLKLKIKNEQKIKTNFEAFETELIKDGFYKSDKGNFVKVQRKKNYEKRFKEIKNKYS